MKAHQPTVRFNLAALALNNCTLTLTTFITATVAQFNNSAKVSPFHQATQCRNVLFFPKITCAFRVSLDGFSIGMSHALNRVLEDRAVTE